MSVRLTHTLLKNKRVHRQLPLRLCAPNRVHERGVQPWGMFAQCLSSEASRSPRSSWPCCRPSPWKPLASGLVGSSRLGLPDPATVGYLQRDHGTPGAPSCHPAGQTPLPFFLAPSGDEGRGGYWPNGPCPRLFLFPFLIWLTVREIASKGAGLSGNCLRGHSQEARVR